VVIWLFWSFANLVKSYQQEKLFALDRPGAAKLMQPITGFIKLAILLFGILFWLANIGVNISTVLAGLGVGGLALALALQKPIEDMMGALSLFTQAPIKVGDFCKYGQITGIIEDISLRSTRIRTLTNTLVHVPNARIAHIEIENFSQRTKIRYWPTLRLRYDTTPDQLRTLTANILAMLEQNEQVHELPLRVRFTDFDEDAILIKINSFLKTTDFPESLEIAEELNLRIMEIVDAAGTKFALPGKSIYMEDGSD
jgi:MscS family membrane protein